MKLSLPYLCFSFISLLSVPLTTFSQFYTGANGAYFESNDFNGWGGGVHIGKQLEGITLPNSVKLGLELEVLFIKSDANKRGSIFAPLDPLPSDSLFYIQKHRKVDVTQVPIFLNARLSGHFCESWPIQWYLGGGLGIQWFHSKDSRTIAIYNANKDTHEILNVLDISGLPADTQAQIKSSLASIDKKHSDWMFAGQMFAGLAIAINSRLMINTGVRALISEDRSWLDKRKDLAVKVSFGQMQVGYELGINYQF